MSSKILILLILFSSVSLAQVNTKFVCNYYSGNVNEKAICNMLGFQTRQEAQKAVENIVKRSGLKQNFYVMECPNIDNCFAALQNGERLIVYDAGFMRKVNNLTQTDWGAMSILAHEIGHHLQGHTLKTGGSDPVRELEADEFSGFVMYQMGATLKEAQSAIWKMTTDYDSGSHPPRSKRMKSIKKGYDDAAALYPNLALTKMDESNKSENVISEIEENQTEKEGPVFNPGNERGEIVINGRPEVKKVENNIEPKVEVIKTGCVAGSCKNGYGEAINRYSLEKYSGSWKNGSRSGFGTEYYADGQKKYQGDFENSIYEGQGTYFYKNGDKYMGKFRNGLMQDEQAVYYKRNGDRIFAHYIKGKKQGKGRIIYYGGVEATVYYKDDVEL